MSRLSRRQLLLVGGLSALAAADLFAEQPVRPARTGRFSINFGTLLGFKLSLEEEIDVAAKAGYDGIEPWTRKIDEYLKNGGKLSDVRKRIDDHGMKVVGSCAFFPWLVDDETRRAKGIEQMKREMEWIRELGGTRIPATAAGEGDRKMDDYPVLGERYRTILEIGEKMDVIPQLEIWGRSKSMSRLSDVLSIAVHAGHPKAEFLLDVYHLWRGGTSFESLALLNGRKMTSFHINDYPADPPREQSEDKHRVYPGDGVAPLGRIFDILAEIGYQGYYSFEVFNQSYWDTKDPILVAKTGLDKMKRVFER